MASEYDQEFLTLKTHQLMMIEGIEFPELVLTPFFSDSHEISINKTIVSIILVYKCIYLQIS